MSYLTDSRGDLVQYLWPSEECKRLFTDTPIAEAQRWEIFPTTVEDMVDWAEVIIDKNAVNTFRNRVLIYKASPTGSISTDVVYPVTLRLNGYIDRMDIKRLGNWDGNADNIRFAHQFITLVPGSSRDAWLATVGCLNTTATFISRALSIPLANETPFKNKISLQRKVFYQHPRIKPITASFADDPKNWLANVPADWTLDDEVVVGRKTDKGKIVHLSHMMLSPGDFVEVSAGFDIVFTRDPSTSRNTIKIYLAFEHILSILPAQDQLLPVETTKKRKECESPNKGPTIQKKHHALNFSDGLEQT
ncbi:hypothetical protein BJ138DRAFT_1119305 [Hygrophoropsis aurantiaca]|uniref:Uncharacterized protein n=1 Tax=Hygrophoropsis aurantiaca TaxID=72124 RepID=A0ACB7ZU02_9AGAM|nr:hypothetical protein BJ138DRAFT_1119305 [Hygrophoropsis aurantiaca]